MTDKTVSIKKDRERHIRVTFKATYTQTRCPYCEGRGVLYHGAPDALETTTETCSRCNGKGKVMSAQD